MTPLDRMAPAFQAQDHSLSAQLLAFHAELARIKSRLLAPAGDAAASRHPADVGDALCRFLQSQDLALQGRGGLYAAENQAEARYLKAALADESLIGLAQWDGHGAWLSHLLEMRLFNSRCAGERVFGAIDALLRVDIPARREMATLYLLALAMGFQGRYRGVDEGPERLRRLRARLYSYAGGGRAVPALDDERTAADPDLRRRMLPQAYDYTMTDAAPHLLPDPRRWAWLFAAAAIVLLLLANGIWQARTAQLAAYFMQGAQAPAQVPAAGLPAKTP